MRSLNENRDVFLGLRIDGLGHVAIVVDVDEQFFSGVEACDMELDGMFWFLVRLWTTRHYQLSMEYRVVL